MKKTVYAKIEIKTDDEDLITMCDQCFIDFIVGDDSLNDAIIEPINIDLERAIHQFLGFAHAKKGYGITGLTSDMGLSKEEYLQIRHDSEVKEWREELDEYFCITSDILKLKKTKN